MAAKKTTTKKAAKPAPATKAPAKKAAKKAAAKAPAKKAAKKPAKPAASSKAPSIDEIAAAAYQIYLRRIDLGLPGDQQSDWAEAERQLGA